MYRPDFQKLLADGALKAGARIEYSSHVTDMDVEKGSIILGDGVTIAADLIVCADGENLVHNHRSMY